jgi:hypothetical protein
MSEENKSKEEEMPKEEILLNELSEYGYTEETLISQSELSLFLDRKSPKNKFDISLLEKLYSILNLTEYDTVTVSQFVSGFLKMDEEIRKSRDELNEEYSNKKKNFENILDMCKRYQSEKLNEEGFSENARLSGDIIESTYNVDLDGIDEIILSIIYGDEKQEIKQNVKQKEEEDKENNKHFELKALSGKEHLEFKLMTRNYLNYVAEIGSKTYSLEGIQNQEPFFIKVEIPFDDDFANDKEGNLAAIVKAKIALRWSDYEYYEQQQKNEEPKLKKLLSDLEQAEESIKKLDYIFSAEKKNEKNEAENNVRKSSEFLNRKILEFPDNNFIVDFNNERIDTVIRKGIKVDFNNEKEVEVSMENQNEEENKEEEKNEEENKKEEKNEEENKEEENKDEENKENENDIQIMNDNNNINNSTEQVHQNFQNFSYEIMNNSESNIEIANNNEIKMENILSNNDIVNQGEQINLQDEVNIFPEKNITSYTDTLLTQSTRKALIQENTLPLKYLPQKINKVIYDTNISTLPLIDAGKKVTYVNMSENNNDVYNSNIY